MKLIFPFERGNKILGIYVRKKLFNATFLPYLEPMLFNLTVDPFEQYDLSGSNPRLVSELERKLRLLIVGQIRSVKRPEVAAGNPSNFGGFYSPGWCQSV